MAFLTVVIGFVPPEVPKLPINACQLPRRSHSRWATLLLLFVGLVLGTGFAWRYRADLLPQAVDLWSVSDPVGPADVVAVLGGGMETRPFAAADYYRQGLVSKVLVSNGRSRAAKAELLPSDAEVTRNLLVRLGVPETAIELVGTDLSNTFEEALALRRWAVHNSAHRLIVPTEYFSSRRVRWIMRHELAGTGVEVLVPALDDLESPRARWWQHEKGVVSFQNELIKYLYYRLKY
jgi:uncharacterized SAM-binding protein YcdF (DUF218 family)